MFLSLHYETFQNELYSQLLYGPYYNQNNVQNILRPMPPRIYYRQISNINGFMPNNSYLMPQQKSFTPESRNLMPENPIPKTENTNPMAEKKSLTTVNETSIPVNKNLKTENKNSTPEIMTVVPTYHISYLQKQVIILIQYFQIITPLSSKICYHLNYTYITVSPANHILTTVVTLCLYC